jgi:hypothetical protein
MELLARFPGWEEAIVHARNPAYRDWLRRTVPGGRGFLACHHPSHIALKRPSAVSHDASEALPVVRSFNAEGFSFLKVSAREVFALFHPAPDGAGAAVGDSLSFLDAAAGGGTLEDVLRDGCHPLMVNASPFAYGHSLFVPFLLERRPQVASAQTTALACRLARVLTTGGVDWRGRSDVRIGFNSLAAWASVNHTHFHVTYAADLHPAADAAARMPIEAAPRTLLFEGRACGGAAAVSLSRVQWPLPCFLLRATAPASGVAVEAAMAAVAPLLADCHASVVPHHCAAWWEDGELGAASELLVLFIPRTQQDRALCGMLTVALLESLGIESLALEAPPEAESPVKHGLAALDALTEEALEGALAAFAVPEAVLQRLEEVVRRAWVAREY